MKATKSQALPRDACADVAEAEQGKVRESCKEHGRIARISPTSARKAGHRGLTMSKTAKKHRAVEMCFGVSSEQMRN